jgi:apolipoprotein N-acyltransferase
MAPLMRVPALALLMALLAGALTVFAFAPYGWWVLQVLALALLFLLALHAVSARHAFLLGWGFAFAALATGTHWLYVSMHDYGHMPGALAVLAVLLLSAGLALLYGGALALAHRLSRARSAAVTALLLLPGCWMLADWLRAWVFTGFPWLATGYAHTDSPLAGYAPLLGVYGISWLGALLAATIALSFAARRPHTLSLALLVLIPAGGQVLTGIAWTQPQGETISVRLLQGNVAQDMKFSREQLAASLSLYQRLISAKAADLIVTPETALPMLASQLPEGYLARLAQFSQQSGSQLLVGVPWSTAPGIYFNSVIGIADGNPLAYRYDKHHLVPFGEFIPPGARWFVDLMQMPLGDFGRGDLIQVPFAVRDQAVLPNICYEDLFGEEIATQIAAAADRGTPVASILLNLSNIAWFGDTIALPQHLQISRMRSLETGRPMLRATNTGATAVIDARGQVTALLPPLTEDVLEARVQGMRGLTPYVRVGNTLPVGLALAILLAVWLNGRRQGQNG